VRETERCELANRESGSRALSRFGAESEQIYLVTRDRKNKELERSDNDNILRGSRGFERQFRGPSGPKLPGSDE